MCRPAVTSSPQHCSEDSKTITEDKQTHTEPQLTLSKETTQKAETLKSY